MPRLLALPNEPIDSGGFARLSHIHRSKVQISQGRPESFRTPQSNALHRSSFTSLWTHTKAVLSSDVTASVRVQSNRSLVAFVPTYRNLRTTVLGLDFSWSRPALDSSLQAEYFVRQNSFFHPGQPLYTLLAFSELSLLLISPALQKFFKLMPYRYF